MPIMPVELNILGTVYTVIKKSYTDDTYFDKYGFLAYCDCAYKQLVLCDLSTHPDYKDKPIQYAAGKESKCLRHEITHAYIYESGLDYSSHDCSSWAVNEEMVDWFAIQSPKILRTFAEANCI